MSRTYNAEKLMPPALFRQLHQYCAGMTIYTPRHPHRAANRRLKVLDLATQGFHPIEIARRMSLSEGYIYQIIMADRKRAKEASADPKGGL
jgi:DNA-binding NarL/FixJ family response regulator